MNRMPVVRWTIPVSARTPPGALSAAVSGYASTATHGMRLPETWHGGSAGPEHVVVLLPER